MQGILKVDIRVLRENKVGLWISSRDAAGRTGTFYTGAVSRSSVPQVLASVTSALDKGASVTEAQEAFNAAGIK